MVKALRELLLPLLALVSAVLGALGLSWLAGRKAKKREAAAEADYKKIIRDTGNIDNQTERDLAAIRAEPINEYTPERANELHERTKKPWPPPE